MPPLAIQPALEALHLASYGWALSCCAYDAAEAGDVLQETYLQIFEGRARYEGRASVKTWLFAVIRRSAAGLPAGRRARDGSTAAARRARARRLRGRDRRAAARPAAAGGPDRRRAARAATVDRPDGLPARDVRPFGRDHDPDAAPVAA